MAHPSVKRDRTAVEFRIRARSQRGHSWNQATLPSRSRLGYAALDREGKGAGSCARSCATASARRCFDSSVTVNQRHIKPAIYLSLPGPLTRARRGRAARSGLHLWSLRRSDVGSAWSTPGQQRPIKSSSTRSEAIWPNRARSRGRPSRARVLDCSVPPRSSLSRPPVACQLPRTRPNLP